MMMRQQANIGNTSVVHIYTHGYSRAQSHREQSKGPIERDESDCVHTCFDDFIGASDTDADTIRDTCSRLQNRPETQQAELWSLYCCDTTKCGVYAGAKGDSPSVDNVINRCQNLGFYSIQDPGPPQIDYCASHSPAPEAGSPLISVPARPSSPVTTTQSGLSRSPSTPISTFTSGTIPPIASTTASTNNSSASQTPDPAATSSKQLQGGPKAAIVVFSIIGAIALVVILLYLLRRKRSRPKSKSLPGALSIPGRHSGRYPEAPSGSETPLITPPPTALSSSRNPPPLTPPARLSDRRYLQSMLQQGGFQPSGVASTGDLAFPETTLCSPTHNRFLLEHERRATTSNVKFPLTTSAPVLAHYAQSSSVYSANSGPETSSLTVQSIKASSIASGSATVTGNGSPPLSPTTPAGPPPNRALPAPPLNHPNSPTFSVSPISPRSPTFSTRSLVARAASPAKQSLNTGICKSPPLSASAQELCELTESYARESWGSWSGVGGGGPGVTPVGRKRGSGSSKCSAEKKREAGAAVGMQELDLEKLSGRY